MQHLHVLERHLQPVPAEPPQIRHRRAGLARCQIAQKRDQLHQRDLQIRGIRADDGKAGDSKRVAVVYVTDAVEASVEGVLESPAGGGQRFGGVVEVQDVVRHRDRWVFEVQDEPGIATGGAGWDRHWRFLGVSSVFWHRCWRGISRWNVGR